MHIYIYIYIYIYIDEGGLKSSNHDVISAAEDFFDRVDPSTATQVEKVCGPQGLLFWKINIIWFHSIWISWSPYDFFRQLLYI